MIKWGSRQTEYSVLSAVEQYDDCADQQQALHD
jgi:hypothetical protein